MPNFFVWGIRCHNWKTKTGEIKLSWNHFDLKSILTNNYFHPVHNLSPVIPYLCMLDQHKDPPYTMIFLSTSNKCGRKQHNQQLSSWVGHHSCRNLQSLLLSSIQTVDSPQNHLSTSLQEYSKNGNCLFRKTVTLSEGYDNQIKIPYNFPLKKKTITDILTFFRNFNNCLRFLLIHS